MGKDPPDDLTPLDKRGEAVLRTYEQALDDLMHTARGG
jgi:hypothetical protein